MKPAIRQASRILAKGSDPLAVIGPCPPRIQIEGSALNVALALGNLLSSSYSTTRETMGRERAHDWLLTVMEWFAKLQAKNEINLNVRIVERE
jgi:hypothetical protein